MRIRLGLLHVFVWLSLAVFINLVGCHRAQSPDNPIPVAVLAREYEESKVQARRKYDGHELLVRGHASTASTMPLTEEEQGSLILVEEAGNKRQVVCWFSKGQSGQFGNIRGGQYLTVKGVFNGEAGAELKFCRLVKVE